MCLGVPGTIVEILPDDGLMAVADINGIHREINLACVADNTEAAKKLIGAWVLIHVGFAMAIIDEAQARQTLAILSQDELAEFPQADDNAQLLQ